MDTSRKKPGWVLITILMLILVVLGIAGFLYLASQRSLPTPPTVTILHPKPNNELIVGDPVIIRASATDPEGIEAIEFWVNGERVGKQLQTESQTGGGFFFSQAFRPTEVGPYTIYVRAVDNEGYSNESPPIILEANEFTAPETADVEVITNQGDTIDSLAEDNGVSPQEISDKNPNLGNDPIPPGTSVTVPVTGNQTEDQDDPDSNVPPVGQPNHNPPAGSGPGISLTPIQLPGLFNFLPDFVNPDIVCKLLPQQCNISRLGVNPPPSPGVPFVNYTAPSCEVEISWLDTSTNESGFRIYRQNRLTGTQTMVVELNPLEDIDQIAVYVDVPVDSGQYRYLVSAFNSGGETFSNASQTADVECPLATENANALELGLGELSTTHEYNRLYCYISLMGTPHERFPASQDEFIFPMGDEPIPLADFFGRDGFRNLVIPEGEPFTYDAECWGWQGGNLVNLGSFGRVHPPEDWNGQVFTAGPDSGSFTITYTLAGLGNDTIREGQFESTLVPPPFNLRRVEWRLTCTNANGCPLHEEPSLIWDFEADLPEGQDLAGFRVYRRTNSGDQLFYEKLRLFEGLGARVNNTSPLMNNCDADATFYVTAVTRGVHGEIESLPSEEFFYETPCQIALEITLETLETGNLKDGAFNNKVEAYGFISLTWADYTGYTHGYTIEWNGHPNYFSKLAGIDDPELYIAPPPFTSKLSQDTTYYWSRFWLGPDSYDSNIDDGWYYLDSNPDADFGKNNNSFTIPMYDENETFVIYIDIVDDDGNYGDDLWCEVNYVLLNRPAEEWLDLDTTESFSCIWSEAGEGTITIHIQGVEYDE